MGAHACILMGYLSFALGHVIFEYKLVFVCKVAVFVCLYVCLSNVCDLDTYMVIGNATNEGSLQDYDA